MKHNFTAIVLCKKAAEKNKHRHMKRINQRIKLLFAFKRGTDFDKMCQYHKKNQNTFNIVITV